MNLKGTDENDRRMTLSEYPEARIQFPYTFVQETAFLYFLELACHCGVIHVEDKHWGC